MRTSPTYKHNIALDYCKKYHKSSTMAIARLLNKNYPIDFKTVENARSMVRHIRGEINNGRLKIARLPRDEKTKKNFMKHQIPSSDYEEIEAIKLSKACNNILFLSDIHIPYHDEKALQLAIDYGKENKVNCIYLNGDTIDMYMASRFIKDRRLRDIAGELEMTREFLRYIKELFDCPIYYKIGNHEERWQNFLMLNAPEILGITDFELSNLLRFGELGITEVKSKQTAYAGKLALLHGHEFGYSIFSPVNPARGLYMKAKESSVVGHHHQSSEHSEKSLSGDVVTTWSVGALCGMRPEYLPINKWNHGFAHIIVKDSGNYSVKNIRIINNKIV